MQPKNILIDSLDSDRPVLSLLKSPRGVSQGTLAFTLTGHFCKFSDCSQHYHFHHSLVLFAMMVWHLYVDQSQHHLLCSVSSHQNLFRSHRPLGSLKGTLLYSIGKKVYHSAQGAKRVYFHIIGLSWSRSYYVYLIFTNIVQIRLR